jgi:hypothetical protein
LLQRLFKQRLASEPVEITAERADAIFARQLHLLAHYIGLAQIVEAQFTRQAWLCMSLELRQRTCDVVPFGEALAPPRIVLWNRMKLRQVERHEGGRQRRRQRAEAPGYVADRASCGMRARASFDLLPLYDLAAWALRQQIRVPIQKALAQAIARGDRHRG